ncbi:AraC family transcriptional regulator [Mediterraneibacter glycyrrhizinilyticus]|uniref:AraC family transcriptional regulator n=1 Tax=Mediterraneibacter glycyrrhizinilyticus TaxID=342942 RepID=UPI0025AB28BC|nr:AraC family transcriptional regulator [Mediterraneibacter glycyrrhizinilyticus]MDN0043677.1 helix-turn-helix domain-containing protein [Mediterraneibacter glycyrrhizinilyticus]
MKYQGISLDSELQIDHLFSLHYFEYMNSFYFPGESHPFWEFVCVDKGEVTIGAGDHSFILTRGEIAFHEPDEFHWVRAGGRAAPNLIVISFSSESPMMDFFRGKVLHVNEADRRLLARIVNEARTFLEGRLDDPYQTSLTVRSDAPLGAAQIIRTCLEQFLIGLARRYRKDSVQTVQKDIRSFIPDKTTTENADEEMFSQIAAYLSDNLSSHITIEKICSDNLIGRSRLQKLFHEKCGLGIIEYFSHMKIDAAKQLIRNEQMNFTQISENLGYSSIHYFSRQFKKITGMTPSEYASSIKAMSERTTDTRQPL